MRLVGRIGQGVEGVVAMKAGWVRMEDGGWLV